MSSLVRKRVLVTGGAGYIGSHTCVELLNSGYEVVVMDNFSNSSPEALTRVKQITGCEFSTLNYDICQATDLDELFAANHFDAVIHFAGFKAVGESVFNPLNYFSNNISGTLNLLRAMERADVRTLVFSSSATVYGDPERLPISESAPLSATNPYGRTKLVIEQMLTDVFASDNRWKIANLRYFNPVGAHESGLIGEDPKGIPNNLMPYIAQVAIGLREKLTVFGNDYPTVDGTGVRDFIHVVDLAKGHLAALEYLSALSHGENFIVNLGTGRGVSVLELVKAFEAVNQLSVRYEISKRRPGDVAACYADVSLANEKLGWQAELDVDAMCADVWRWQSRNPSGY